MGRNVSPRCAADDLALARKLLLYFVETGPDEFSAQSQRSIQAEGPEQLTFAWASGLRPDTAHYFRVSTNTCSLNLTALSPPAITCTPSGAT